MYEQLERGVGLQKKISGNHGLDEDMIIATHRSVDVGGRFV